MSEFQLYKAVGDANSRVLGFRASQNRLAIAYLSAMLDEIRPSQVIEIGTNVGGLSCLLGLNCKMIGSTFWTFDTGDYSPEYAQWFHNFSVNFVKMDVFSAQGKAEVEALVRRPGPTVLLCDGGNKIQEVCHFSPALKVGDVIGAHDYFTTHKYWTWCETNPIVDMGVEEKWGLEPYYQDDFDKAAWWMRRRVK